MLEYASVTASAYDVDSLVGKLNAHASQGWEVTSVVAAGGDVVAIMQRVRSTVDSAPAEAATEEAPVVAAVANDHVAVEAAPVVEAPVIEEAPAFSEAASSLAEVTAPAVEDSPIIESVAEAAPAGVAEAASSAADHAGDAFGSAGAGIAGAAAGVGLGSIFGNDAPAADVAAPAVEAVTPVAEVVAPVIETVAPAVAEVPAAIEPTGWGSAQTTVGTPVVPTPAPAPAPVVTTPAGWYPDPSGRFEMRYWDGSAWTEHVSRQGQQFTDPPVA
jgi:Protein of unknown function (DUF2510)